MKRRARQPCAGCLRLQAQRDLLRAEIHSLRANVAQLQEQLAQARKDSSTSSKPPSSDIVKPAPPDGQAKRAIGGQPGHPRHERPLPPAIATGGLAGPRLTTLIACLKGACQASYSTIRKFLRDLVGVEISRGQLADMIDKVSWALDEPYQMLLENLPRQATLNVDETGHPESGERWWTWCFRASLYTIFHGVLLIQFQEGRKLRAEASPGQKTADVSEFNEAAATMYER